MALNEIEIPVRVSTVRARENLRLLRKDLKKTRQEVEKLNEVGED